MSDADKASQAQDALSTSTNARATPALAKPTRPGDHILFIGGAPVEHDRPDITDLRYEVKQSTDIMAAEREENESLSRMARL